MGWCSSLMTSATDLASAQERPLNKVLGTFAVRRLGEIRPGEYLLEVLTRHLPTVAGDDNRPDLTSAQPVGRSSSLLLADLGSPLQ